MLRVSIIKISFNSSLVYYTILYSLLQKHYQISTSDIANIVCDPKQYLLHSYLPHLDISTITIT